MNVYIHAGTSGNGWSASAYHADHVTAGVSENPGPHQQGAQQAYCTGAGAEACQAVPGLPAHPQH